MKGIKLQPREKLIVTIAALAIIGYGFYTFWFTPYSEKIANAKAEVQKLESETRALKTLASKEKDLANRKGEMQAKALELKQQLPTGEAMPSVLNDVKTAVEANGAIAKNVTLDKTTQPKGLDPSVDCKVAKVTVAGDYLQIAGLVKFLETTDKRTFTVSELSLNKTEKGLSGTMTVEMYFFKTSLPGYEYTPLLETQGKFAPF